MNISVNVSLKALQMAIFYTFSADRRYENGTLMLDPHTDDNYYLWPVRNYTKDGLAPETVFEFKIPKYECAGLGDPHAITEFFRNKYETFLIAFEKTRVFTKATSYSAHCMDELPSEYTGDSSRIVVVDMDGKRKNFQLAFYDFENSDWVFMEEDKSLLEPEHAKWMDILPFADRD